MPDAPERVAARWPAGDPRPAGITSRIEGTWIPRPGTAGRAGGTLAVAGGGPGQGSPTLPERLRTVVAGASRELYGARAPLVDALMLGRRGGIDPELQDRFAQSGLVHLLSISGFHVGLIGAWVFLGGAAAPRAAGARADHRRSREHGLRGVPRLARAGHAGRGAGRWCSPAAAFASGRCAADELLAATCLAVLLIDPWAALDLGGWLSAAALWGAARFSRWTDGALGRSFGWRTLGSSVGATLATGADHRLVARDRRAGGRAPQLRRHSDRGRCRARRRC